MTKTKKFSKVWIVVSIFLTVVLFLSYVNKTTLLGRLGFCDIRETKITVIDQGQFFYNGTKLQLSIVEQPKLAARIFEHRGDVLTWFDDITSNVKTVADELMTIRPLEITKTKIVVCISKTEDNIFKNLTDGEKIDKYLPVYWNNIGDKSLTVATKTLTNNLKYNDAKFSFEYPKNLFLYEDNVNIWLFSHKVSKKDLVMYSEGWNLPNTYMKVYKQPNNENFSPKQFYLYHLYSFGPKYLNGDINIDKNRYTTTDIFSVKNTPVNLMEYGSYIVGNNDYLKVIVMIGDEMLIMETNSLDTFSGLLSSLKISN